MRRRARYSPQENNLPHHLTVFVGREREITEIKELLSDPACRLLTLVGPGGIGKTRLAIESAAGMSDYFADGVYFVPLQAVPSAEFLTPALADALDMTLSGHDDPRVQLLNFLRDKALLLVLDNFEQLLAGAELLTDVLQAAPAVKLLVTSREVLNLQEEWLYRVEGMPYPADLSPDPPATDEAPPSIETYPAVQLFVERAKRVRRDFLLTEEQASVIRICRLVEGMPLALELAASWTKTMPGAVIADEIERNINFLATGLRNIPEQHRSMQAVFDHSWALLNNQEQNVFKRLAVFRGGFRREAAEQIAGASLLTLSSLVNKSLLRWDPDGRYQVHELLRQYAEEHLHTSPEEPAALRNLHCAYYASVLDSRRQGILAGRQREVIADITADLDNIRAAWQWAVDQARVVELHQSVTTLDLFYQMTSRYLEGAEALAKGAQGVEQADPTELRDKTLSELLVCLGWCHIRLGQIQEARVAFERGQAIYKRLDTAHPPGDGSDPLVGLGTLANIRGHYAEAAKLGEQARQQNEASGDRQNLMVSHYVLANAALAQGDYEAAQQHAQQAYAIAQVLNDRWTMAYFLIDLGHVVKALGDYVQARQHYQAAYELRQEFDDPEGMAVALNHLAEIARLQQDAQTAGRLYRQSRAIYRDIGDKGGLAAALKGLGQTACAEGDYRAAQHHLQEALQITSRMQFVPLTLAILMSVGEWLLCTGRAEPGAELLAFTQHHPAGDQKTKARAQQLLADWAADLDSDDLASVTQRDQSSPLETMVAAAQAHLAAPVEAEEEMISPAPPLPRSPALVEPLTERELEVLGLIAEGLTNREIAEQLSVVIGTVKAHNNSIYGKLGVSNRVQALARGRELGLL